MKINDYNYLDQPAEHKGSLSLYPNMFPLKSYIYYVAVGGGSKNKTKGGLIIPETAKNDKASMDAKAGVRLMVIATGPDCKSLQIGDYFIPEEGFLLQAKARQMDDGAEFFIGKEPYVESIFKPKTEN